VEKVRRKPAAERREHILSEAAAFFADHGFQGTTRDLANRLGITQAALYKHFASKDDLMVAAVRRRDEWESAAWDRAVRKLAGDDPAAQFLAMLDVMHVWFNDPDFRGCLFLNTAAEFPNPHDPVHRAAAEYKRRKRDYFRDLARAAGAGPAGAETFADGFTVLIEGALVLRQSHGRNDAAQVVRPAVEQLMAAYLPEVPRR
jgi:AcrR family transcriptional regulator